MLQKELAKRLKARYDTKMDGNEWLEVSSDGIPLCRIKYNGQFLSNADQNLSCEYRSKIAYIQDEISTVREYVGLYEHAPQMKAADVSDYRQLAAFGDTVLAATYSEKNGFMFCTWKQNTDGNSVFWGDYSPNYESVMSTVLSRLNAFLDSELEQVLCFDSAIDAEKFASEKSAIFLILPEEDTTKNFMAGLMIQNLSRELFAVADENGGKLQNRAVLYCDEFGTMPPFDVLPLFSAGRSRRLTLVPIIQSLAQLEKNYGKEGSEIIQDNCQDTIFGGFAPNSQTAEVLSKALGNRTVLSGSVSRGKNDPSQSLQMMERPLLTPDELKSIPKGNFIVQKTGQHPMRTRLRLFLEWGISFEEPYIVPERVDRAVAYANREDLERNLPQSSKAENADMRGAYAVSGRGGIAHEPAVDKPRRRGGKQMKTYGEEDL
jgi:hypothetical protein